MAELDGQLDLLDLAATICPTCHADKNHFTPAHVAEQGMCWLMYTHWNWLHSSLHCVTGNWPNSQGINLIPDVCCGQPNSLHGKTTPSTRTSWLDHARHHYRNAIEAFGHQRPALEQLVAAKCHELGIDPNEVTTHAAPHQGGVSDSEED